uniref:Uncharacterized protein n=1 Tax=Oryza brachyantha TaxID=4533 RepID=J3N2T4_ORYBR
MSSFHVTLAWRFPDERRSRRAVDLLTLASRQCQRASLADVVKHEVKARVLAQIQDVEKEIISEKERLESILKEVGINDSEFCSDEIETLQREIDDCVVERWTSDMIALLRLLCHAASVHSYRHWLGRNQRVVERVVLLVRTGPSSTKKDVLAALLCLSNERESVAKLVEVGALEAALSTISEETTPFL